MSTLAYFQNLASAMAAYYRFDDRDLIAQQTLVMGLSVSSYVLRSDLDLILAYRVVEESA